MEGIENMTMAITPVATAGTAPAQKSPSFTGRLDKAAKTAIDATIKEFKIENNMDGIGRKIFRYGATIGGTAFGAISALCASCYGLIAYAASHGLLASAGISAADIALAKLGYSSLAVNSAVITGVGSGISSVCNRRAMNLLPQFAEKLKAKGLTPEQVKAGLKRYIGQTGFPIYSRLLTRSSKLNHYAGTASKA